MILEMKDYWTNFRKINLELLQISVYKVLNWQRKILLLLETLKRHGLIGGKIREETIKTYC